RLPRMRVFRHYPAPLSPSGKITRPSPMSLRRSPAFLLSAVFAAAIAISGCAGPGSQTQLAAADAVDPNNSDPWEYTNRDTFAFNQAVDKAILVPVAEAYRTVLPGPVRDALHNFLVNLNAPVVFANDVLQVEPRLAGQTFGRFLINTTLGLGGLIDLATPS